MHKQYLNHINCWKCKQKFWDWDYYKLPDNQAEYWNLCKLCRYLMHLAE